MSTQSPCPFRPCSIFPARLNPLSVSLAVFQQLETSSRIILTRVGQTLVVAPLAVREWPRDGLCGGGVWVDWSCRLVMSTDIRVRPLEEPEERREEDRPQSRLFPCGALC